MIRVVCTAVLMAGAMVAPSASASAPVGPTLYLTNADGSNSISVFTIRPAGDLEPVGDPVKTEKDPRGIVLPPSGDFAYVVNAGASMVSSYRVGARGELTPIGQPVETTGEPFGIAVAPDGRAVYVTAFDATITTFVVQRDGSLAAGKPLLVDDGRLSTRGVKVSPDGRYVFVSTGDLEDPTQGVLATFAVRADHTLELLRTTPIDPGALDVGVTADGRFLYVACSGTDQILPFRIGPGGGLTPLPPAAAPVFPISTVIRGRLMFVTVGGDDAGEGDGVWVFTIGSDGTPRRVGDTPTATGEVPLWPASDGRHLYVSNQDLSAELFGFDVSRDGQLTPLAGSPFPARGRMSRYQSVAIQP